MQLTKFFKSKLFRTSSTLAVLMFALFAGSAYATLQSGISLASVTSHVNTTVSQMARILTDVALIAGIGFILAAFFKFHQHKLNPTQVPISQGVTLLLIGACLTLFVVMLPTAKRAIFGSAEMAKVGGSQMTTVIGAS